MSVSVTITGMPADTRFPKVLHTFRALLKKVQIKKFWIREITDMYDNDCKQMTVEFPNSGDARKARSFLHNMPYTQGQVEYLLMAHIDEDVNVMPPEEYHQEQEWVQPREPRAPRRSNKRSRPRSRSPSPGYRREADKLDMEIELLRKQRQVVEEERRLLLEQKKLEMIREFGPGASQEFNNFEPPRKRHQPSKPVEVRAPRKREPPPPIVPNVPRLPNVPNAPRASRKGLPLFKHTCTVLISEMKAYIEKDTTPEEVEILIKLIRAAIRKNLAIALEGKDYMPTRNQVKMYRELHPSSTDEALVAKVLRNIRASYLPNELDVKPAVKTEQVKADKPPESEPSSVDIKVENETEESLVEENPEDKAVNDTAPQENDAIQEKVTDAASKNGDLNLESKSQELETAGESKQQTTDDNFWEDVVGNTDFA